MEKHGIRLLGHAGGEHMQQHPLYIGTDFADSPPLE
jgi:hypothetical protein